MRAAIHPRDGALLELHGRVCHYSRHDPGEVRPRGIAIRFHLADHVHDRRRRSLHQRFPRSATARSFCEFLRAVAARRSGPARGARSFLAAHPNAKRFVETPSDPRRVSSRRLSFLRRQHVSSLTRRRERHGRFASARAGTGVNFSSDKDAAAKSERLPG